MDEGTTVVKFYLHISKDEQKERLQERLEVPEKNWKFARGDLAERELWDDYQNGVRGHVDKDLDQTMLLGTSYRPIASGTATSSSPRCSSTSSKDWTCNGPPPEEGLESVVIE